MGVIRSRMRLLGLFAALAAASVTLGGAPATGASKSSVVTNIAGGFKMSARSNRVQHRMEVQETGVLGFYNHALLFWDPNGVKDSAAGCIQDKFDVVLCDPTKSKIVIRGGNRKDVIYVNSGVPSTDNVTLRGRGGPDDIHGGPPGELIVGGRGRDRMFGSSGVDVINARDGRRDKFIYCQADGGTAKVDSVDPAPKGC